MSTTSKVNTAFGAGMLVGGLIVILMFMFLVVAGDKAAASEPASVCDTYAAPASCNTENPPTLFTPAPPEKAWNCVEKEEIGHCSDLLAQTGDEAPVYLIALGVVTVAIGCLVILAAIWMRHAAQKRDEDA